MVDYSSWYENGSDRGAIFILTGDPWVMSVFGLLRPSQFNACLRQAAEITYFIAPEYTCDGIGGAIPRAPAGRGQRNWDRINPGRHVFLNEPEPWPSTESMDSRSSGASLGSDENWAETSIWSGCI